MFFRSKEQSPAEARAMLEDVRAKLDAAIAEEAAAEQALKDAALDAALSSDPLAAEPQREALRRAREAVEILKHAVVQADAEVVAAENRAKAALRKSQHRAVRQHIAALTRAAARYQEGTAICVAAYRDMVAAGEAITRLLPANNRTIGWFADAVSPQRLTQSCLAELGRVGAVHPLSKDHPAPGATWHHPAVPHGLNIRQLPPLADWLKDYLLAQFQRLVSGNHDPVPAIEPRRKQVREPTTPDFSKTHLSDPDARTAFMAEVELLRGGPAPVEVAPVVEPGMELVAGPAEHTTVEMVETADDPTETETVPTVETAAEVEPAEMETVAEVEPANPSPSKSFDRVIRQLAGRKR